MIASRIEDWVLNSFYVLMLIKIRDQQPRLHNHVKFINKTEKINFKIQIQEKCSLFLIGVTKLETKIPKRNSFALKNRFLIIYVFVFSVVIKLIDIF